MSSRRILPVILLLFIASGCAALIYEVVWFQLLQLVIGSSAVSLAVLLGTYMGGLCLGSLAYPKTISQRHHPLRVYAVLELGIGLIGILVLVGLPLVSGIYTAWAGSGLGNVFLRALASALCLLPPTVLMGATLPALSRWVETTPEGVSWMGFFYAGNTGGAVLGSLLAGFYLLRVHDMPTATFVAVALNATVALVALTLARTAAYEAVAAPPSKAERAPGAALIYVVIALSGMTAMAAEVIWTRSLSLLFGATTYTFSLILAAFLLGIGIGSAVGSGLARNLKRPRVALGWSQAMLAVAIAWTAYMLTDSMPYWPVDPSLAQTPWFNFQIDFARCLWCVLPASILWGATFPLALASAALPGRDPARLVGGLYGANTIGTIVGSLVAGLLLVVWIGSQHAQQVLVVTSAVAALLALWPVPGAVAERGASVKLAAIVLAIGIGAAALAARAVHAVPGLLVAYGRYSATRVGQAEYLYVGEGINADVAVSRLADGTLNYHNAGKVQASSEPQDMRLQRMLGHLTTLLPKNPRRVLVIGCGAGVTAGAVSIDPRVEQETIAEIEPLVVRTVSTYFSEHNFDVVHNPKVRIRLDDARHFLQTTHETFDAVTSDPLDPWVKGAAMLYSREFFELVKRHLNPGGVVTLFVQLYWTNEEAVKSELATFFEAFPNGVVWGNTQNGEGYDLVLMGQLESIKIDVDEMEARLRAPEYAGIAQSLREIGFSSAVDLLATYAGQPRDLGGWLKDANITQDRNLRLQYLAGLGVNQAQRQTIYAAMLAYRKSPDNIFTGSEGTLAYLWEAIQRQDQY
jgi:spermidine synthase